MRPILVSVLAILVILVGFLYLLIGILGFLLTFLLFDTPLSGLVPDVLFLTFIFFVVGIILTVSGIGLWKLRMWAWVLAVIVLVFALIGQAVSFSPFSFVIEVLLLIYLLAVKQHFY